MTTQAEPVAEFERTRRTGLRRQRIEALVGVLVFSALLLISFQRSDFFASDIGGDPLGRIAVFLGRMTPDLQPAALLDDKQTAGSMAW